MSTEFTIRLEPHRSGSHVVSVAGELDIATAHDLDEFLARLDGTVVLDCASLSFVDASGIRGILQAAALLDRLELVNVRPMLRRVFEVTDTTSLLVSEPSSPDVLRRLDGGDECDVSDPSEWAPTSQEVSDAYTL
jgi:anti-anti-sigma factor